MKHKFRKFVKTSKLIEIANKSGYYNIKFKKNKSGIRIKSIKQRLVKGTPYVFSETFKSNTSRGKYLLRYRFFPDIGKYSYKQFKFFNRFRLEKMREVRAHYINPIHRIAAYNKILFHTGHEKLPSLKTFKIMQKIYNLTNAELWEKISENAQKDFGFAYTASVRTLVRTICRVLDIFNDFFVKKPQYLIDHDKQVVFYINKLIDFLEANEHEIDDEKCMKAQKTAGGSNKLCDTVKDVLVEIIRIFAEEIEPDSDFLNYVYDDTDQTPLYHGWCYEDPNGKTMRDLLMEKFGPDIFGNNNNNGESNEN